MFFVQNFKGGIASFEKTEKFSFSGDVAAAAAKGVLLL